MTLLSETVWLFTCIDEIVWYCSLAIRLHTKEIDSFILVRHWHLSVLKIDLVGYIFIMTPLCWKIRPLVSKYKDKNIFGKKQTTLTTLTKSLYYFTYNSRGSESLPINTSCIFFSPFHLKWMCMNQLKRYCFWYTTNYVTWVMGNGINLKQNCSSSLLPTYHLLSECVSLSPSTHFSRPVPIVPLHQIQPYTPAEDL